MGTKRVGLARLEALMENLKREIVGFNVENTAAAITTHADGSGDATLVRNTVNLVNEDATAVYTLPAASTCQAGDVIIVKYGVDIPNAVTHKYGRADEFLAVTSVIHAEDTARGKLKLIAAPNGSSNDILTLTGATDAGCGIGSELKFHFDGSQWSVSGKVLAAAGGAGTTTVGVAFGDT